MGLFGKGRDTGGSNGSGAGDAPLERLAKACEAATDNRTFREFWSAMFAHPEWHFLNDPADVAQSLEQGHMPRAMAGVREPGSGRFAVTVFTSGDRANAYHNATKGPGVGTATLTTCMSPRNAVERLAQLGDDVHGVIVNYDGASFAPSIDLNNLVTNYEFDTGDLPEGAWPRFCAGVQFSNADVAWERLYAQLVNLPSWTNLSFEHAPTKPVVHMQGDDVLLVLYTHRRFAEMAGSMGRIPGTDAPGMDRGDGQVGLNIGTVTPREMMGHLEMFREQLDPSRRLGVLFNAGVSPFGFDVGTLRGAFDRFAA